MLSTNFKETTHDIVTGKGEIENFVFRRYKRMRMKWRWMRYYNVKICEFGSRE